MPLTGEAILSTLLYCWVSRQKGLLAITVFISREIMDFFAQGSLWVILAAAAVLLAIVGAWLILEVLVNPTAAHVEEPDVTSSLTGNCGDTMQIRLKIENGTVVSASYWADGCGPTSACGSAATRLCIGLDVDEIPEQVHAEAIEKAVGGLPPDHLHCARLAAETLQEAAHKYLLQTTRARSSSHQVGNPREETRAASGKPNRAA